MNDPIEIATLKDVEGMALLLEFLFEQEADFSPDIGAQEEGLRLIVSNPGVGTILFVGRARRLWEW